MARHVGRAAREMNNVREEIKENGKYLSNFDRKIKDNLLRLPNLPDESVPAGKIEKDNKNM